MLRNSSSRQVMHPRLIDYSEEDESDRHFFSAGKSRIVARKRYQFFQTTELKQVAWEKLIRWKATSPLFQQPWQVNDLFTSHCTAFPTLHPSGAEVKQPSSINNVTIRHSIQICTSVLPFHSKKYLQLHPIHLHSLSK